MPLQRHLTGPAITALTSGEVPDAYARDGAARWAQEPAEGWLASNAHTVHQDLP